MRRGAIEFMVEDLKDCAVRALRATKQPQHGGDILLNHFTIYRTAVKSSAANRIAEAGAIKLGLTHSSSARKIETRRWICALHGHGEVVGEAFHPGVLWRVDELGHSRIGEVRAVRWILASLSGKAAVMIAGQEQKATDLVFKKMCVLVHDNQVARVVFAGNDEPASRRVIVSH